MSTTSTIILVGGAVVIVYILIQRQQQAAPVSAADTAIKEGAGLLGQLGSFLAKELNLKPV